jgi:hypothetical protein
MFEASLLIFFLAPSPFNPYERDKLDTNWDNFIATRTTKRSVAIQDRFTTDCNQHFKSKREEKTYD